MESSWFLIANIFGLPSSDISINVFNVSSKTFKLADWYEIGNSFPTTSSVTAVFPINAYL